MEKWSKDTTTGYRVKISLKQIFQGVLQIVQAVINLFLFPFNRHLHFKWIYEGLLGCGFIGIDIWRKEISYKQKFLHCIIDIIRGIINMPTGIADLILVPFGYYTNWVWCWDIYALRFLKGHVFEFE